MPKKWVLNASPLIALGKINSLDLIKELVPEVVIPIGVAREITQGPDDDPAKQWLLVNGKDWFKDVGGINPLVAAWDLGRGESEVISWAYDHHDYEAVLDDRAARNCAKALNIKVRGTIGILLLAKKKKILDRVSPLLDRLVEVGIRIDPRLMTAAKKLSGEEGKG